MLFITKVIKSISNEKELLVRIVYACADDELLKLNISINEIIIGPIMFGL